MASSTFSEIVIYFFIYSIAGYICEVLYCSAAQRKWVNRGFFFGPYCPIYGFGALLVLHLLEPFSYNPWVLFPAAVVITTVLEYFSSWALEKVFDMKWWDYSQMRFNLNGRICLWNSVLFGLLSLFLVYVAEPFFGAWVSGFNPHFKRSFSSFLLIVIAVDFVFSVNAVTNLKKGLEELSELGDRLKERAESYSISLESFKENIENLRKLAAAENDENVLELLSMYSEKAAESYRRFRLIRSYPNLVYLSLSESLTELREEFEGRINEKLSDISENIKERTQSISDKMDNEKPSFASGLGGYKLFWVFLSSGILGYAVESVFELLTLARPESRQGFMYGPFNHVYGICAVLMVLIYEKFLKKKNAALMFFVYFVFGGMYEALVSFIQSIVFKTVSWDYSHMAFSILGGRTNLVYMVFWGVMGLVFVRKIYPFISKFAEGMPNKQGYVITWILIIISVLNLSFTNAAVLRWSERHREKSPSNAVEEFLDEYYPDEVMGEIFPNMMFVE